MLQTPFFRIKQNVMNTMVINGKYKLIPYILLILVVLFILTKLIYEFIFFK
jgi:hypothetical protein